MRSRWILDLKRNDLWVVGIVSGLVVAGNIQRVRTHSVGAGR
jgi:hypothetical protein